MAKELFDGKVEIYTVVVTEMMKEISIDYIGQFMQTI